LFAAGTKVLMDWMWDRPLGAKIFLWLKWQGGERILDVRPPGLVVPEKGKERKYENRVKAKKKWSSKYFG
jgi:hypothetical protein